MLPKDFDAYAKKAFGQALEPHGFSCTMSRQCTFYRWASEELIHVVLPDRGTKGTWFDVKVFATSPVIIPSFGDCFPDDIGIPSDLFSYLHHSNGVGCDQDRFHCRTVGIFHRIFEQRVAPSLVKHAIPFLDNLTTVTDLIPTIRCNLSLGLALAHVGRNNEADPILRAEKARLKNNNTGDEKLQEMLRWIDEALEQLSD